ncbi:MAG: biotin transporter BioY [Clostridiaceae bacterium]|nr:biotin transporter BioY [Clostridiaceae bacterium]
MTNSKLSIRQITICALMIATLVVCTQISFNLPGGIPVTMQTYALALIGFLLGLKLGTFVVGAYLILGLIGLPVFSNFGSGPAKLVGPTGGYLIGFIPMIILIGLAGNLIQKNKSLSTYIWVILLSLAGLFCCHLLGIVWLAARTGMSLIIATINGSVPFIFKDIVSVVLGYLTAEILSKPLNRVLTKV